MTRRSVLDHPLLSERLFFPRPDPVPDPFMVPARGADLACWRSAPHAEAPTVIHFHGNGETVADYLPGFAAMILALGVNLILAEYRGYGGSTGTPRLSAVLDDSEAVFRAARLRAEEVIAFGRSLGSYAAVHLASRHRLAGLILESGIADPMERLLLRVSPEEELGVSRAELAAEVDARLAPGPKLARHTSPVLVLHAVRDELVNATHAVALAALVASPERELVLLPRGGHNDLLAQNHDAYVKALRGFLARVQRTARGATH